MHYADLLLRLGVAFAFLYPPVSALGDPDSWLGYFPPFLLNSVPEMILLHVFGALEVVIALWILSGKKIFWPSIAATAMLLAIIFFNWGDFQVLFRDLSIAAASLALALMHKEERPH